MRNFKLVCKDMSFPFRTVAASLRKDKNHDEQIHKGRLSPPLVWLCVEVHGTADIQASIPRHDVCTGCVEIFRTVKSPQKIPSITLCHFKTTTLVEIRVQVHQCPFHSAIYLGKYKETQKKIQASCHFVGEENKAGEEFSAKTGNEGCWESSRCHQYNAC